MHSRASLRMEMRYLRRLLLFQSSSLATPPAGSDRPHAPHKSWETPQLQDTPCALPGLPCSLRPPSRTSPSSHGGIPRAGNRIDATCMFACHAPCFFLTRIATEWACLYCDCSCVRSHSNAVAESPKFPMQRGSKHMMRERESIPSARLATSDGRMAYVRFTSHLLSSDSVLPSLLSPSTHSSASN